MQIICHKIGIPYASVPRTNASTHNSYYTYYDVELNELVYNAFKVDFDTFGYKKLAL